jgi:hypothetical protein
LGATRIASSEADDRQIARGIDREAATDAHDATSAAATTGPDEPAGVHQGGVEGDGVGQVGAVLHHLADEGLAGRHVEAVDHRLERSERHEVPDGHETGQGEEG